MTAQPDTRRAPGPDASPEGAGGPMESTIAWIGPFVVFMVWLALDKYLPIANPAKELLRDTVLVAAIFGFAGRLLPTSAPYCWWSMGLGLAVFRLWFPRDPLIPGCHTRWLLKTSATGRVTPPFPPAELT